MPKLIAIKNISCGYFDFPVLKNISFEIEEGDFLGIIGPNGSGKSTLLKSISHILKPYQGVINYNETNLYSMPNTEIARNFAFVPQDSSFNFTYTAWEIVLMGRIPYLKPMQKESKHDFELAAESMRITDTFSLKNREVDTLSAGEKQMVIIAKALTQEPKVLFLDEPTSHLDIGHQIKILNLLKALNKNKKITVIIVLHDLNLASEYCDNILLLNEGEVEKAGAAQEVLTYETIESVYKTLVLVNKNPISGKPHILLLRKEKT